jgi:hypothetical protein
MQRAKKYSVKKILISFFLVAIFVSGFAQGNKQRADSLSKLAESLIKIADSLRKAPDIEKAWNTGGIFNIGGTQVSLSDWVAGGQNSISIGSIFNGYANYKKNKIVWDNSLVMQYGIIKQGGIKNWRKNDDQFQFTSKLNHEAFSLWSYSLLADFKSQFTPGYNYPNDTTIISNFLAPGYGILALGLDFKLKDYFAILFAPATGKFTIVNDAALANEGAFGVTPAVRDTAGNVITPGKKFRSEIGGYVKVKFKKEVLKNFTIESNLELFSNYLNNPGNIDVVANTLLSVKFNRFLTLTWGGYLIYDDDVKVPVDRDADGVSESTGPRPQFKNVTSLAFSLKF